MTLIIKPINEFALQKTDTPDGSFFGFDWWDETDLVWRTAKILSEDLAAALSKNFANADLTATGNRSHDFNNFSLEIKKCSQIKFEVSSAPPTSEAAVKITGYGASSSDISFQLLTNVGTAFSVFGDLTTKFNGKVYVNTNSLTGGLFQMEIAGTNGIFSFTTGTAVNASSTTGTGISSSGAVKGITGASVNGVGIEASTSGTGTALSAKTNTGLAARIEGQSIFEEFGGAGTADPSALVDFKSTTKGIRPPSMTTTERDAIPSPATGLIIDNITTNRLERFNGSYWAGDRQTISILHGSYTPVNSTTAAFGLLYLSPQTNAAFFPAYDIKLRGNGVIRACTLNVWCSGTVGTSEAWSLYIRHNSTDYLVATVSSTAAIRVFENTALNIPYVDGDIFKMIYVNPTTGTRASGVLAQGTVTLE